MIHRVLSAVLALACVIHPCSASERDARIFIEEMLGGVAATATNCPATVREAAQARRMGVVCARFDGSFETFRSAWKTSVGQSPPFEQPANPGRAAAARPQTGWQASGENYERIYSVGRTVVGVRFVRGDVVFVYK